MNLPLVLGAGAHFSCCGSPSVSFAPEDGKSGGDGDAALVSFGPDSPHSTNPPLIEGCSVVSISSVEDVVWCDALARRWADVAGLAENGKDGRRRHVHVTLKVAGGVEHIKIMCHKETMRVCFGEIGVAAAAVAGR